MKQLNVFGKLVISLCLLCAVVSCSDDDKDLDPIVGKWQFDKYEVKLEPSLPPIEALIKEAVDGIFDVEIAKNIATLNENGTYLIEAQNGINIDNGQYSFSGNKLTLNPGREGSITLTVLSNAGGKLTLEMDLDPFTKEFPDIATEEITKGAIRIMYDIMYAKMEETSDIEK